MKIKAGNYDQNKVVFTGSEQIKIVFSPNYVKILRPNEIYTISGATVEDHRIQIQLEEFGEMLF